MNALGGDDRERALEGRCDALDVAMKSAVLVFPGINRERDMARTLKLTSGHEPREALKAYEAARALFTAPAALTPRA